MNYLFLILAFLTGVAITIQAGVNANLRAAVGHPVLAASISFGAGFLSLLTFVLVSRIAVPPLETIRQISWWKWTGGLIGAVYVTTVIVSVPKIGTANLISLSVAGQLLAAVVLDHYGCWVLRCTPPTAGGCWASCSSWPGRCWWSEIENRCSRYCN